MDRTIWAAVQQYTKIEFLSSVSVTTAIRVWWVHSPLFCVAATTGQAWTLSNSLKNPTNTNML